MKQRMISIIIPVYNAEMYIERCINSIFCQSYENWEMILINDGSTDSSAYICNNLSGTDKRIHVCSQENKGVSAARNRGIELMSGELLLFLDADDWLEHDALERISQNWEEGQDLLIFDYNEVKYKTAKRHIRFFKQRKIDFLTDSKYDQDYLLLSILHYYNEQTEGAVHSLGVPWGKVFRADFFRKNRIRFPQGIFFNEDIIFNLFCIERMCRVKYISIPLYNYLVNDGSISSQIFIRKGIEMVGNFQKSIPYINTFTREKRQKDVRYWKAYRDYILSTIKLVLWWLESEDDLKKKKRGFQYCYKCSQYLKQNNMGWGSASDELIVMLCSMRLFGLLKILTKMKKGIEKI